MGAMGVVGNKKKHAGARGTPVRRRNEVTRRERGAYALEFALVFAVFLILVLGLVAAGVSFASQQLLTLAAEDGARASLRYQADVAARGREACAVAERRAEFLRGACVDDGATQAGTCNALSATADCQYIRVVLAADSLLPMLPGVPRTLAGVAMVRLDAGDGG